MTQSIFDPGGDQTERSGSNRYMGPAADNDSRMPPDVVDGDVDAEDVEAAPDENAETEAIADVEAQVAREDESESQSEL
ncbi:MAG TPA: hypothetical protein VLJ39_12125 [Tepidisphaeraceae bacterium]|nr:hypothetical protein [Tepidisphaeraceae bacterium]